MSEDGKDKERILFQYIMNYKAYRRKMIAVRIMLTLLAAGGLAVFSIKSITLGIVLALMALFLGAISILVSLHNEMTYIVFNTRIVIKNKDKRADIPLENLISVKYGRAFYEKDLGTGTITLKAKDPVKGRIKKYRMRHVFAAGECVAFLQDAIDKGENDGEDNR